MRIRLQKAMESPDIDLRTFYELKAVHGEEHLEAVTIFDNRTGVEETIECDNLLLNLGFVWRISARSKSGALRSSKNTIVVNSTMETSLPGVYAAGDICTYHGKLKLIATGIGEAGTAANFAKTYIDPVGQGVPGPLVGYEVTGIRQSKTTTCSGNSV